MRTKANGRTVTLRDERDGRDSRHLWAYLDADGNLHIDGQDLGPSTWPVSGDGEYEWKQTINAADVPRPLRLLGSRPTASVLSVLKNRWSGIRRSGELERVIGDSGIDVHFSAWAAG